MKKTIKDYNVEGKRVIIRCDLNVPIKDNVIEDDTRIRASIKSIKYLSDNKAKVIVLSHLGKVKEESDKKDNTLFPVSKALSKFLGKDVYFSKDTSGDNLTKMVDSLKDGEVLLVENTRFEDLNGNRESGCDLDLAKYWSTLGDIFINDAYGTLHRKHASNVGIAKYLDSGIGFLVEQEVNKIDEILEDNINPFVVIMGGKKVNDKIKLIENMIKISDKIIIGGAMAFTFLKALGYNVGSSYVDVDSLDFCHKILDKYKNKIILPIDFNVGINKRITDFNNTDIGYDIGCDSIILFKDNLKDAKRVIMNGPLGLFEDDDYTKGTYEILKYLSDNNIKTLIGGGDSAYAVIKLGFNNKFYHVSTGGGATLKYLENRDLPGLEVIDEK